MTTFRRSPHAPSRAFHQIQPLKCNKPNRGGLAFTIYPFRIFDFSNCTYTIFSKNRTYSIEGIERSHGLSQFLAFHGPRSGVSYYQRRKDHPTCGTLHSVPRPNSVRKENHLEERGPPPGTQKSAVLATSTPVSQDSGASLAPVRHVPRTRSYVSCPCAFLEGNWNLSLIWVPPAGGCLACRQRGARPVCWFTHVCGLLRSSLLHLNRRTAPWAWFRG